MNYRVEGFEINPLKVAIKFSFLKKKERKKTSYAMLSQNLISKFSSLFVTPVFS